MPDDFHKLWVERHGHPPTGEQRESFDEARYWYAQGARAWQRIDLLTPSRGLGTNLKALRKSRSWTQQDVADQIGLKQSMICKIEKGDVFPSIKRLFQLADIFGVSVDELVSEKT